MLNWTVLNRTVFDVKTVLTLNWIVEIEQFWHLTVCKQKTILVLNWIVWNKTPWQNWIAWNRNVFDN